MRILIISHSFFPACTPRALRWGAIAEEWDRSGHSVDVVSGWEPGLQIQEERGRVQIHRTSAGGIERLRRAMGNPQMTLRKDKAEWAPSPGDSDPPSWLGDALRKFGRAFLWPDSTCSWIGPARRKALELVERRRSELLLTVSHPFTGHLVGLAVKKRKRDLPWIADTGDPLRWFAQGRCRKFRHHELLDRHFESCVLRRADLVTVTTPETLQKYAETYPLQSSKLRVIPPILTIPPNVGCDSGESQQPSDIIRMIFAGTLYKDIRNPDRLLTLLRQLIESRIGRAIELHFYGAINDCRNCFDPYQNLIGKQLHLHGLVPQAELIQVMKACSVLVNIANDTSYQIPSKVVEYASMAKPILHISSKGYDCAGQFLRSHPAVYYWPPEDSQAASGQLEGLLRFLEHPPAVDRPRIKDWLRPYHPREIARSYLNVAAERDKYGLSR